MLILTFLLIVCFVNLKLCFGQDHNSNINIGEIVEVNSEILQESRNIFIYTPEGYEESNLKYPTLYVTDGAENYLISTAIVNFLSRIQRIPPMIIVGIPNMDRNRDLSPLFIEGTSDQGEGDNFLNFLKDELIPYLDNTYRTNNYRILFGHSLGGVFANYTLITKPELFNAYITASPYLMYNDGFILKEAESKIDNLLKSRNQLYIALGNEPAYHESLNNYTALLKDKAKTLKWNYQIFNKEDHNSIPVITLLEGLKYVYSDFQLNMETAMQGINAILNHNALLESKYDYKTDIPENTLNIIGYRLMQNGHNDKAIEVFKYNVKLYPNSANVYDSLAEALENSGKTKEAAKNYKIAVKIGKKIDDPNLMIYQRNLARVENKAQ
jgi:predicted alpha/beta superfamily hydrolase